MEINYFKIVILLMSSMCFSSCKEEAKTIALKLNPTKGDKVFYKMIINDNVVEYKFGKKLEIKEEQKFISFEVVDKLKNGGSLIRLEVDSLYKENYSRSYRKHDEYKYLIKIDEIGNFITAIRLDKIKNEFNTLDSVKLGRFVSSENPRMGNTRVYRHIFGFFEQYSKEVVIEMDNVKKEDRMWVPAEVNKFVKTESKCFSKLISDNKIEINRKRSVDDKELNKHYYGDSEREDTHTDESLIRFDLKSGWIESGRIEILIRPEQSSDSMNRKVVIEIVKLEN